MARDPSFVAPIPLDSQLQHRDQGLSPKGRIANPADSLEHRIECFPWRLPAGGGDESREKQRFNLLLLVPHHLFTSLSQLKACAIHIPSLQKDPPSIEDGMGPVLRRTLAEQGLRLAKELQRLAVSTLGAAEATKIDERDPTIIWPLVRQAEA